MAEESLELLLEAEKDDELRRAAESWPSGRSSRVDRVLELSKRLDRLTRESNIANTPKLKKSHFSMILNVFDTENHADRADMAASLIAHLRRHLDPADWLAECHVRALHHGRRFEEMNRILAVHPALRDSGNKKLKHLFSRLSAKIRPGHSKTKLAKTKLAETKLAETKLSEQPSDLGEPRTAPENESDYHRLIQNRTGKWNFFICLNKGGERGFLERFRPRA